MKFSCKKCGSCCKNLKNTSFSMLVFRDEADELRKKAKELRLEIKLEKFFVLTDKKTKKEKVILYKLSDSCPFLSDNLCLIYNSRPLLCRAFPIIRTGNEDGNLIISKICPARIETDKPAEVYGDCFSSCLEFEKRIKLNK